MTKNGHFTQHNHKRQRIHFYQSFFAGVILALRSGNTIAHHLQSANQWSNGGCLQKVGLQCCLCCIARDLPHTWIHWLELAKLCSHQSNIHMTPSKALYDTPPPIHVPYFPHDSKVKIVNTFLHTREDTIHILKHHVERTQ